tara:strand:+ start:3246 stop:3884 length:639 start_codon:yes stop_codon:yes gene_type:complete
MNASSLKSPPYWSKALKYLQLHDPVISRLIKKHKSKTYLVATNTIFTTFAKIIIGQQISIEVANSIENKILKKIGRLTPKRILITFDDDLRNCGLSYRKVNYIKGIAKILDDNKRFFTKIEKMNDDDAVEELTKLYGIGPWSAEMFLIFHYNRQNILPLGDIGLINSFCKNYNVNRDKFKEEIMNIKKKWDPYCTVATWYLWRDIDEDVVQY